ncbi:MAG: VOC family protein [Bacteroidia bacterium]|nr:VOC family protein [Bacteroidia bacterium]
MSKEEGSTPDPQKRKWTSWVEIPVADYARGKQFYETVFEMNIHDIDFGGFQMGIFPHTEVGAAICCGAWYKPGPTGPIVALNANPDLQPYLDRVQAAGGKILQAKKAISPEHGFMALFLDSEGNVLSLHSMA